MSFDDLRSIFEVEETIKSMSNRKAVLDPMSFPLKNCSNSPLDGDRDGSRRILQQNSSTPLRSPSPQGGGACRRRKEWKYATIIIELHEKEDRTECGDFRGISLVTDAGKGFSSR